MTAQWTVRRHWLQAANEGCNSCAILAGLLLSFIACFILLGIAPLTHFSESVNEHYAVFPRRTV